MAPTQSICIFFKKIEKECLSKIELKSIVFNLIIKTTIPLDTVISRLKIHVVK